MWTRRYRVGNHEHWCGSPYIPIPSLVALHNVQPFVSVQDTILTLLYVMSVDSYITCAILLASRSMYVVVVLRTCELNVIVYITLFS